MRTTTIAVSATLAVQLFSTGVLAGQLPVPDGWKWVTDSEARIVNTLDPPQGSWLFGTMAPGWHITSRPAVTLFHPSYSARGRFTLESEIFLFPGTSPAGFGLFVGGEDLERKARYVAFLMRADGGVVIELMDGGRTSALYPWTKATSVVSGASSGDPVRNVLRIEAEAETVTFLVNGVKVADLRRDLSRLEGVVGLRVGADLNLHVTNLDLTHRLAPPRVSKPMP